MEVRFHGTVADSTAAIKESAGVSSPCHCLSGLANLVDWPIGSEVEPATKRPRIDSLSGDRSITDQVQSDCSKTQY